jgi:hypothetical protein
MWKCSFSSDSVYETVSGGSAVGNMIAHFVSCSAHANFQLIYWRQISLRVLHFITFAVNIARHLSLRSVCFVVTMKNAVFWDVAPCRSCVNRRFGGTYRFHLEGRKIRERGTGVSRWLQTESPVHTHLSVACVVSKRTSPNSGLHLNTQSMDFFLWWIVNFLKNKFYRGNI